MHYVTGITYHMLHKITHPVNNIFAFGESNTGGDILLGVWYLM